MEWIISLYPSKDRLSFLEKISKFSRRQSPGGTPGSPGGVTCSGEPPGESHLSRRQFPGEWYRPPIGHGYVTNFSCKLFEASRAAPES